MIHIVERAESHRQFLTHDPRAEEEKLTAYKILELSRPDRLSIGIIECILDIRNDNISYKAVL